MRCHKSRPKAVERRTVHATKTANGERSVTTPASHGESDCSTGDSKIGDWFGNWDLGESDHGLVAPMDFDHTGPVRYEEFGLIDHIAVSNHFAKHAGSPEFWQREINRIETRSYHCGVAVGLTTSISRPSREAQGAQ